MLSLETKGAKDMLREGQDLGARSSLGYQSNGDELFTSGSLFGQMKR